MKPAEQLPAIGAQPVITVEQYAAAQRAEIVAWITAQQHRCARHNDLDTGMATNCCICWWNGAIDGAVRLARGDHGATPLAIAERLQREAT
jgi:hypothetical protein